jgi:hypothetical protein
MAFVRVLGAIVAVGVLAACAGERRESVTLYLKQRLGPDGPPGQIAPVLEPVRRPRRASMSAARQVLVQLRQGPTPDERAHGFEPTIDPRTRFSGVSLRAGTAVVSLAGKPLDYYGVAAVVLSLTKLPAIDRVRVCCLERHDGSRVFVHRRADFSGGWQGTPCELRRENPCLRGG